MRNNFVGRNNIFPIQVSIFDAKTGLISVPLSKRMRRRIYGLEFIQTLLHYYDSLDDNLKLFVCLHDGLHVLMCPLILTNHCCSFFAPFNHAALYRTNKLTDELLHHAFEEQAEEVRTVFSALKVLLQLNFPKI